MADTKITALTALTAADPANDVIPIVDVSDTSMAASGTTKKISVNNILGASGTATLASATITGDLTVDTSTLKVDSTNDRVGIGTASPAQILHLAKSSTSTALTAPPSGGANLRIQNTSSTNNNFSSIEFYNAAGLFGASVNCQSTNQATPSNDLVFVTRLAGLASEQMRVDSTGNVNISTGNVVMATSGKGIDFSATANSSGTMTSELLNDYEEGTWTPVATGLTNVGAVTYTATYTKIGRVVYINLKVTAVTSTTSVANTTFFSGLPFTPALNSTITAVNEGNITSLGVGLIATGSTVFTPNWTAVQNATLSGFYYV